MFSSTIWNVLCIRRERDREREKEGESASRESLVIQTCIPGWSNGKFHVSFVNTTVCQVSHVNLHQNDDEDMVKALPVDALGRDAY
jgi:hypothetical protein